MNTYNLQFHHLSCCSFKLIENIYYSFCDSLKLKCMTGISQILLHSSKNHYPGWSEKQLYQRAREDKVLFWHTLTQCLLQSQI